MEADPTQLSPMHGLASSSKHAAMRHAISPTVPLVRDVTPLLLSSFPLGRLADGSSLCRDMISHAMP
jgi:hypothetical protein